MKKITSLVLVTALTSQLFSCGYFIHPERRGNQSTKEVDWAIVGLDAIGLVFFIVPGVIAYAIDFYSGTIYFKAGEAGYSQNKFDLKDAQVIKIDPKNINNETIAAAIKAKTGIEIDHNSQMLASR